MKGGRPPNDLSDTRFGHLVAKERVQPGSDHAMWRCLCDCGKTSIVRACSLQSGHTRSCGCKRGPGHHGEVSRRAPAVESEKTWKGAEDASATLSALWGMQ